MLYNISRKRIKNKSLKVLFKGGECYIRVINFKKFIC